MFFNTARVDCILGTLESLTASRIAASLLRIAFLASDENVPHADSVKELLAAMHFQL